MSKSIYGIRMPGTMGDVINQLHGLRPLMARRANQLLARAIARDATDHHDRAFIFGSDGDHEACSHSPGNHLSHAYGVIQQRILDMGRTDTRDPEVDTNFDVVICEDGNNAVLLSFTEHHEWFMDLLSLPGAEDFSFWDGTDRPEDISEEDWATRRRTYERILSRDPHGRPAGCGVTLTFQKPVEPPSINAILAEIPSREIRAHRLARQVALGRWVEEHSGNGEIDMSVFMKFASLLSKPEMAARISQHAAEIEDLIPDLDGEILRGFSGLNAEEISPEM